MSAPRVDFVQITYQNPHASMPLILPVAVVCNTSDEDLERNIRTNSARDFPWLRAEEANLQPAVIVGGGPSVSGCVEQIRALAGSGAAIFACNAASQWLRGKGIEPDCQVICDAKQETSSLVDQLAQRHLFASQVHADTMDAAPAPVLWHLGGPEIEHCFPPDRIRRGGYALVGGGSAVGNSALCVAYALGHRDLHVFGLDSSHSAAGESHAYAQPMNAIIPTCELEWAGRRFTSSVAMKAQAEKFQMTAQALKQLGCTIQVYGDGLLQHMYTTPPANLTERDKYRLMWQFDSYRTVAPGELVVDAFVAAAEPDGLIIDFGCGTGRAGLRLHELGFPVLLIDFADNCRDHEALGLPFLEWDLTRPCPARGKVGLCTDVMEHIPPEDVDKVLANIFEAVPRAFFQISTVDDVCGALISAPLHLSVNPHAWWRERLSRFGHVAHEQDGEGASIFYVERF